MNELASIREVSIVSGVLPYACQLSFSSVNTGSVPQLRTTATLTFANAKPHTAQRHSTANNNVLFVFLISLLTPSVKWLAFIAHELRKKYVLMLLKIRTKTIVCPLLPSIKKLAETDTNTIIRFLASISRKFLIICEVLWLKNLLQTSVLGL